MIAAWALATALNGALPRPLAERCPVEHARYVLRGDPKFFLGLGRFRVKPEGVLTNVYLFLHSGHTHRTFWFYFDGGASGQVFIYSMNDPNAQRQPRVLEKGPVLDSMTFISADGGVNFYSEMPSAGDPAPKYIFIPELAEVMRHGTPDPPELESTQLFVLNSCVRKPDSSNLPPPPPPWAK